ncbi:MAG: hypothetical protein AAFX06_33400 [Planctomycetota bacterium]
MTGQSHLCDKAGRKNLEAALTNKRHSRIKKALETGGCKLSRATVLEFEIAAARQSIRLADAIDSFSRTGLDATPDARRSEIAQATYEMANIIAHSTKLDRFLGQAIRDLYLPILVVGLLVAGERCDLISSVSSAESSCDITSPHVADIATIEQLDRELSWLRSASLDPF